MNKYKQGGKLFDFAVDPFTAPTRLQIIDEKSIVVVNNNKLVHVGYNCTSSSEVGQVLAKWEYSAHQQSTLSCGAGGLSLSPLQSVRSLMLNTSPHVLTTNSVGLLELWSVDSSKVQSASDEPQSKKVRAADTMEHVAHSTDGGFKNGAKGWCDVAVVNAPGSSLCCSASYYGKELKLYDLNAGFAPLRSIALGTNATALSQVEVGGGSDASACMENLVAVAQGGTLCVYDHRQASGGGCVVREVVSQEPLWTVCLAGGDVLVAGADRTVYTFDARTWRPKAKFRSTCKFDIAKLMPSQLAGGSSSGTESQGTSYFIAGCDNELFVSDIRQIMPHSQERKQESKKREEPSFSKKCPADSVVAEAVAAGPAQVELGRNKAGKATMYDGLCPTSLPPQGRSNSLLSCLAVPFIVGCCAHLLGGMVCPPSHSVHRLQWRLAWISWRDVTLRELFILCPVPTLCCNNLKLSIIVL